MRNSAKRGNSETRFPLSLHRASGLWCKRIRGKLKYFGRDKDAALIRWNAEKQYLLAGLPIPTEPQHDQTAQVTLSTLCNTVLLHKQTLVDAGTFSLRTLKDYRLATDRLLSFFGGERLVATLRPSDFVAFRSSVASNVSAVTCGNRLRYIRAVLKYAYDAELTDKPLRFERSLALPPSSLMRLERRNRGVLLFSAAEIRRMLYGGTETNASGDLISVAGASTLMRVMILLAINAAFGSTDCAKLTFRDIDLVTGCHTFPRPKTHAERKCWLWPETVAAIQDYLNIRPEPADKRFSNRVFLTQHGGELVTVTESITATGPQINVIDYVAKSFERLLNRLKLKRPRHGFYCLRRTHRTVSDEVLDQPAAALICGHVPSASDMSAVYRQQISDERLKAVSDYVRNWLFNS